MQERDYWHMLWLRLKLGFVCGLGFAFGFDLAIRNGHLMAVASLHLTPHSYSYGLDAM